MKTRIISAFLGAPLLISAVLWPGSAFPFVGWPFALLALAMVLVGLREFYDGCRFFGLHPSDGMGYAASVYLLLLATPLVPQTPEAYTLGLTLLVLATLIEQVVRKDRAPLKMVTATWMGVLYVGWLLPFALRIRLSHPGFLKLPEEGWSDIGEGAWLLLFTMLVTSAVDTGAYFVGKAIGKHKLAPVLSPGKTIEGSVGGVLAAFLVAAGLAVWWGIPFAFAMTAAALIGVLSQFGDLAKSAIKREIGVKDFGTLIPGHGGVLDRFDSLLFTAPAVYYLLSLGHW